MAFGKYCKEENVLIRELKRIRLYNPSRLNEVIDINRAHPLVEYSFSTRIERSLLSAGITTVEQLAQKTERDLLRIRNMGKTSIKEIRDVLRYYGYSLQSVDI